MGLVNSGTLMQSFTIYTRFSVDHSTWQCRCWANGTKVRDSLCYFFHYTLVTSLDQPAVTQTSIHEKCTILSCHHMEHCLLTTVDLFSYLKPVWMDEWCNSCECLCIVHWLVSGSNKSVGTMVNTNSMITSNKYSYTVNRCAVWECKQWQTANIKCIQYLHILNI